MMVVPVLMMSCQVSEKPATGPIAAQPITTMTQSVKVMGLPAAWATPFAARVKACSTDMAASGFCAALRNARADLQFRGSFGRGPMPREGDCVFGRAPYVAAQEAAALGIRGAAFWIFPT